MKKLMIAAAIVCATVCANAYEVQWGAAMMGIPQATDVTKDQTGIKTTPTSTMFGVGELTMSLYWVATTGNEYIGDFTLDAAGAVAGKDVSSFYDAMVEDRTTDWKPQFYATATYETADGTYTFTGTATSTKKLSQLTTGNVTATMGGPAGSWDYVAKDTPVVPEPTSAMLLLLGVAGLALKRRHA